MLDGGGRLEAGRRQAGSRLEAGWREAGGRLEAGWRQAGGRLEAGWREAGGRLEAGWRQAGGRLEGGCASCRSATLLENAKMSILAMLFKQNQLLTGQKGTTQRLSDGRRT